MSKIKNFLSQPLKVQNFRYWSKKGLKNTYINYFGIIGIKLNS